MRRFGLQVECVQVVDETVWVALVISVKQIHQLRFEYC